METRTINQTKIYKLIMNPMTDRTEAGRIAAVGLDKQKLIEWYESQKNEGGMWKDDRWNKTFKEGSPLEWLNPVYTFDIEQDTFGHGIGEEWTQWENVLEFCNRRSIPIIQ